MAPKPIDVMTRNVSVGLIQNLPLAVPSVHAATAIMALYTEVQALTALRSLVLVVGDEASEKRSTLDTIVAVLQELSGEARLLDKLNDLFDLLIVRRRTYLTFRRVLNDADPDFAVEPAEFAAGDRFEVDAHGRDEWVGNGVFSSYVKENLSLPQAAKVLMAAWELIGFASIVGNLQPGESVQADPSGVSPSLPSVPAV